MGSKSYDTTSAQGLAAMVRDYASQLVAHTEPTEALLADLERIVDHEGAAEGDAGLFLGAALIGWALQSRASQDT